MALVSTSAPPPVPTLAQLDLFRAMEDLHDMTQAAVVLLTDAEGVTIAVSGDEDMLPPALREALAGAKLAAAGSVRALLGEIDLEGWPLNVSVFDVDGRHVLAIVFDAEVDVMAVTAIGAEAKAMLRELCATTAPS